MNPVVYLFGRLNGGSYTQYPDDGTSGVLGKLYPLAKAATQVIIRRDGNFMYYCYIRKLQGDAYIGMCVLLNGTYIKEIKKLFSMFETRTEEMCEKGIFICYDGEGNIRPAVSYFYEESEEATFVAERIRLGFSLLLKSEKPLPPMDFSVAKDSECLFNDGDVLDDIVKASCKFGYTCVYKQADYDTIRMNSYRSVLKRVNDENNELKQQNKDLHDENETIKRQKKQFKNVVILCILIAICGIGLFFLKDSLDSTKSNLESVQNELTTKKKEIVKKQEVITELNGQVDNLQTSLSQEKTNREKAENKLSKVESCMPVVITDVEIANVYQSGSIETDYRNTIYSSYTMYLKPRIKYTGIKTGENITLSIKLYTPTGLSRGPSSPSNCSWTESFYVSEGDDTQAFQGWGGVSKGHWSSGTYRYEFWYGNVCLKAKTFTIY